MDLCAISPQRGAALALVATATVRHRCAAGWRAVAGDGFDVRVSARRRCVEKLGRGERLVVVRAAGKRRNHGGAASSGGSDSSVPEGDDVEGTNPDDNSKPVKKSHHSLSDWRDFRANLVIREQEKLLTSDSLAKDETSIEPSSRMLGLKWAHPIAVPETGCVLVATEKLDGVPSFERTVVLLLRLGSRDPREGPFGIILNRPLTEKIRHLKPSNLHLATTFAECSLYRGGPLDANMFLLNTGDVSTPFPSFEKVLPGICFGARNSLDEAAALVKKGVLKPQDFRFFVGYAGWQFDQLLDEIESNYWVVAACSSQLISVASADTSSNLWEEILQLMGGRYSELSRKPKQDSA